MTTNPQKEQYGIKFYLSKSHIVYVGSDVHHFLHDRFDLHYQGNAAQADHQISRNKHGLPGDLPDGYHAGVGGNCF